MQFSKSILPAILLITGPLACLAQEEPADKEQTAKDAMARAVRVDLTAYQSIENTRGNEPLTVRIQLGDSVSESAEGEVYDGLRFTAPKELEGRDFIWYFNCPAEWAHWYIIPVQGDFGRGFRNWIDADCLYQDLDSAGETDRQRTFQSLDGDYFQPGREYILWFRKHENRPSQNRELRAVLAFAALPEDQKEWDSVLIEGALQLKRAAAEDQVKFLNSRGGRAMLDPELFDPADARSRIDNVFFSIRSTSRLRGGFFITSEIACPPCIKSPKMAEVRARHGEPDCTITQAEHDRVHTRAGDARDEKEENLTQHFYDYFAFETDANDPEARVQRVRTHASNFGKLRPPEKGSFMRSVGMKNLSIFYQDGKEVGRMYYFMEGSKKPLVILEPPMGAYADDDDTVLKYEGDGKWLWLALKGDKELRRIPFENHVMHGMGEGFHENGKPSFRAPYRNGNLHGEAIQLNEEGNVILRRTYEDGEEVAPEKANGRE